MRRPTELAPTQAQLNALRRLAVIRGVTFVWPETRAQASAEITRLSSLQPSPRHERRRDKVEASLTHPDHLPTNRVHDDEVTGYGSTAAWKRR
jgi:hypothetical protein